MKKVPRPEAKVLSIKTESEDEIAKPTNPESRGKKFTFNN